MIWSVIESYICGSCCHILDEAEKEKCMGLCPKCGRDSLEVK